MPDIIDTHPALDAQIEALNEAVQDLGPDAVKLWVVLCLNAEGVALRSAGCSCLECSLQLLQAVGNWVGQKHGLHIAIAASKGGTPPKAVH